MDEEKLQKLEIKASELEAYILKLSEAQSKIVDIVNDFLNKSQTGFDNLKQEQSEIIAIVSQNMDTNQKVFISLQDRISTLENK